MSINQHDCAFNKGLVYLQFGFCGINYTQSCLNVDIYKRI